MMTENVARRVAFLHPRPIGHIGVPCSSPLRRQVTPNINLEHIPIDCRSRWIRDCVSGFKPSGIGKGLSSA